ncbi:hypothetical protein SY83_06805 [Paenibacillus swuensis]|uniref:Circadian input-output histidine kinase CikA n=1 Tax=Paenibacillus swuensis TaxID=1178515 RepID=A0A172TP02_9BACL|nr:hypothetical protein SY83_06805 [Paenibacillus swuensis]
MTSYLLLIVCLSGSVIYIGSQMQHLSKQAESLENHLKYTTQLTYNLEKHLLEIETGMRGYLLSGDMAYLEPYNDGKSLWSGDYNALVSELSENPEQQRNLEELKKDADAWINDVVDPLILLRQEGNSTETLKKFRTNSGLQEFEQLRIQLQSFKENEEAITGQQVDDLNKANQAMVLAFYASWFGIIILVLIVAYITSRTVVGTIGQVTQLINDMTTSDGGRRARLTLKTNDEIGDLVQATNRLFDKYEQENWVEKKSNEFAMMYFEMKDTTELTDAFIRTLSAELKLPYGAVYLSTVTDGHEYVRTATYAGIQPLIDKDTVAFTLGEGLVGQCARNRQVIKVEGNLTDTKIVSGLGHTTPRSLLLSPIEFDGSILGVVELASLQEFTEMEQEMVQRVVTALGITLHNVQRGMELTSLYSESQTMNEELMTHTEELQAQSEELQVQADQLQTMVNQLENQKQLLETQSAEVEESKMEIEKYAEQLEESSRYKSEFLANMSHELRTPLNSMLILAQFLSDNSNGTLTEDELDYAKHIHSSGTDLMILISDILDISKVEAGKLSMQIAPALLVETMESLERDFRPVADKKKLQFHVQTQADLPETIQTDPMRLQQILKNFLSNAMKFTEQGSVTLNLREAHSHELEIYALSAETQPYLAFDVIDTGIGIKASEQGAVFNAFEQADSGIERKYGGTGLGLSISKELARLLGGMIYLVSKEGEGSTFTLLLPVDSNVAIARQEDAEARNLQSKAPSEPIYEQSAAALEVVEEAPAERLVHAKGNHVLLVDDDPRNIYALTQPLLARGLRVGTAGTGKESIEYLKEHPDVCLVLMDMMMPEMNGYEATRVIRTELGLDLPIIALTAKAMKQDREKCLEAGASDYISKPIDTAQLFSLMAVWISGSSN